MRKKQLVKKLIQLHLEGRKPSVTLMYEGSRGAGWEPQWIKGKEGERFAVRIKHILSRLYDMSIIVECSMGKEDIEWD